MVKLLKKFFTGDKVFAKVRGYPPWPAKVEKVSDANSKNAKYSVYFYGTGETAVCKVEELFTYTEHKAKFCKPSRRKYFHEGIQQLEQELKTERNKSMTNIANIKDDTLPKSTDAAELPTVSAADSDMESGSLIIDEGEKKKSLKRKPLTSASNTPDAPEVKKKRGRGKASLDTSKQEALDSQGEDSPKEVVSRSGRKIKPKRFADFSSSEETETVAEKNGTRKIERLTPVPYLMVDKETQTSSELFENYTRSMESNETWNLSAKGLKRLILLEQLSLVRLQKAKILNP